MKTKKILILEDGKPIAQRLLTEISLRGYEATWFVGVKSCKDGEITGFCADDLHLETVKLEDYGMAFVDGFLYIVGLMGWDVLPSLKPLMFTIGTSSLRPLDAHTNIEKTEMPELFAGLLPQAESHMRVSA